MKLVFMSYREEMASDSCCFRSPIVEVSDCIYYVHWSCETWAVCARRYKVSWRVPIRRKSLWSAIFLRCKFE